MHGPCMLTIRWWEQPQLSTLIFSKFYFYNFWFLEVFIAFKFKNIVFEDVEFPFSIRQWELQADEGKALTITWSWTVQNNITTLSKISLTVMWRVSHYGQEKLSWHNESKSFLGRDSLCFSFNHIMHLIIRPIVEINCGLC